MQVPAFSVAFVRHRLPLGHTKFHRLTVWAFQLCRDTRID